MSIEERFADLDYPGRRTPKNRGGKVTSDETPVWDAKPVYYFIKGEKHEFFLIHHLAAALGYSVQSIRAWEASGLLPKSSLRSPRTKAPVAGGRSDKGKRLWTRDQILAIMRLASKHKVILNRKPPTRAFAADVDRAFNELLAEHQ